MLHVNPAVATPHFITPYLKLVYVLSGAFLGSDVFATWPSLWCNNEGRGGALRAGELTWKLWA